MYTFSIGWKLEICLKWYICYTNSWIFRVFGQIRILSRSFNRAEINRSLLRRQGHSRWLKLKPNANRDWKRRQVFTLELMDMVKTPRRNVEGKTRGMYNWSSYFLPWGGVLAGRLSRSSGSGTLATSLSWGQPGFLKGKTRFTLGGAFFSLISDRRR